MAAATLRLDRREAGARLMTSASPQGWARTVVKGPNLGRQMWGENADYIMVSGIGGSLNEALELATTGFAQWLKQHYQLDDTDVAQVLGSSIQFSYRIFAQRR